MAPLSKLPLFPPKHGSFKRIADGMKKSIKLTLEFILNQLACSLRKILCYVILILYFKKQVLFPH